MNNAIQYISGNAVSLKKWNECIKTSTLGTLYAEPAFMTAIAGNWGAFVLGDYMAVLPVFPRKKWGVTYLYQPAFIQKSAIYSREILSDQLISDFLQACRNEFKFGELYLANYSAFFKAIPKNNFLVSLSEVYDKIESGYRTDLNRNRKIASRYGFRYCKSGNAKLVHDHFKKAYAHELNYTSQDYEHLLLYCNSMNDADRIIIREIWLEDKLQAACLCVADQQRIYLLLNYTSPEGRKRSANHFLLDQLIKEFAGSEKTLDLEGSDQPGIAHFYQNFGAVNEPFYFIGWNQLPWPFRYLKPAY
ncbi:GNAT family N-acetyltransferase [Flavihumibacter sp. UBA7668]|uniref:GNAT family N-acetyltransferase n=1 Tax=Flavihumibacter sp. UBA7668 TaxID=1946542 RepID=UPI0025C1F8D9|nr:GNAT family N-acetyltransferase [Flavihumibacter sp. UBA7668]